MKLPSSLKFADPKVRETFERLSAGDSKEKQLYDWLVRAFEEITENAFCGIQIPTRLIPKIYSKNYNLKNLWKYNLPDAWRLLYSIESNKVFVVSIVLEWMDHKTTKDDFTIKKLMPVRYFVTEIRSQMLFPSGNSLK
jgi:mRNA-degrading endonuclease RelE of RelBE toxin-antitoxin system